MNCGSGVRLNDELVIYTRILLAHFLLSLTPSEFCSIRDWQALCWLVNTSCTRCATLSRWRKVDSTSQFYCILICNQVGLSITTHRKSSVFSIIPNPIRRTSFAVKAKYSHDSIFNLPSHFSFPLTDIQSAHSSNYILCIYFSYRIQFVSTFLQLFPR